MDYDTDGLAIFYTYAYGSMSMTHENHALVVPSMRLLGLRAADLAACANDYYAHLDTVEGGSETEVELPMLSLRERRRTERLLERCYGKGEVSGDATNNIEKKSEGKFELQRELQVMLMLGVKAEIQVLDRRYGGLELWARRKLEHF